MPAELIDGRATAAAIREELKQRIARLQPMVPGLAAVIIGDHPAAASYMKGSPVVVKPSGSIRLS